MPKIRFNYLGQLGAQSDNEESSTWQISQEDAGQMIASDNTDHLLVNINGAVQNGILEFNIASRLSSILTDAFEEHFQSALVEVIQQATLNTKNGGINTLSDLSEIYLTVNEASNEAPIFFLPPGGGGAESYLNNIIPRLKDKKIILFNNFYHESYLKNDNAQNYYTFQTLATQYIKYIKKIQPVGPYELFGWSFGGVLAFEIARQLENNGDKIAKIILIDPNFQNKEAMKDLEQYWPLLKEKHTQYMLHYQSQCNHGKYITSAPIFLFKFLKVDKIKLEDVAKNTDEKLLSQFNEALACFHNTTIDNHINDYVDCSAIKIIQLTSTHNTWIDSSEDVDLVTKVIIPTKKSFNKNDINKK
jgi:non-ribosomal peptide synthase protein (TIGR01720 family)